MPHLQDRYPAIHREHFRRASRDTNLPRCPLRQLMSKSSPTALPKSRCVQHDTLRVSELAARPKIEVLRAPKQSLRLAFSHLANDDHPVSLAEIDPLTNIQSPIK